MRHARATGLRRAAGILAIIAAPFVLSGCTLPSFGAFKSATATGRSTFHLWQGFSIAAIIIGGGTLLLIIWAALRYRVGKHDDSLPRQSQYHLPLEITYTVVPIIIVFCLFAATVVVEDKVTANPTPATTIDVQAFQWGWRYIYPNAVKAKEFSLIGVTTDEPIMVMPEGEQVRIILTSLDVVHGFYIKEFNFSRYALPGVVNEFTFDAQQTGMFFGQCTQLCGLYHALMWFRVDVVTPAQYRVWLAGEEASQPIDAKGITANQAVQQQLSAGIPTKPYVGAGTN